MPFIPSLLAIFRTLTQDRADLVLENLALRQQLAILQRQSKRPNLLPSDRLFWVLLSRFWTRWRSAVALVKPATVVRWHRQSVRLFWKWKSRPGKRGRSRTPLEVIHLIRRMARKNPTWGEERIQSELRLLGYEVADSTVGKYMRRVRPPTLSQNWLTFLRNHLPDTAACDFFVVPTLTFRLLFCFVVLSHDRRQIMHFNVTTNPTAEWTAHQVIEAFPGDAPVPRYLVRDRDGIYGPLFHRRVKNMGIQEITTSRKSPWQNPYAERVIGSIRRECVDHLIVLSESHLRRRLKEYMRYYNSSRPHLSLHRNAPYPRRIATASPDRVIAIPHLGGLHHEYRRAA
jgi:putative transposase